MVQAFTLAEVLITLGIIGVVAALTLPTLIQNYKVKTTVTKLKKAQSVLSQAVLLAVNEHGEISNWGLQTDTKESVENAAHKIKPYLKLLDDCGTGTCENYTGDWKFLNGIKESSPNYVTKFQSEIYYKLRLTDGLDVFIRTFNSSLCIFMDINGRKEPNKMGEDIFRFDFGPSGYIVLSSPTANRVWANCDKQQQGWLCAEWILQNENMDYLK